jgi:alpha-ribazole phosphatase
VNHIFLLRHGLTLSPGCYCGSTDVALSAQGWRQTRAAVAGGAWRRILSSPLRRCSEFAAALATRLAVPCIQDARLREMHFGDWEGCSAADLMQCTPDALRRFWADPFHCPPPNSEPLDEVRARVLALWRELISDDAVDRVLVITHGGPMRILRSELCAHAGSFPPEVPVALAAIWDTRALTGAVRR